MFESSRLKCNRFIYPLLNYADPLSYSDYTVATVADRAFVSSLLLLLFVSSFCQLDLTDLLLLLLLMLLLLRTTNSLSALPSCCRRCLLGNSKSRHHRRGRDC
jgi:hypothetical protein